MAIRAPDGAKNQPQQVAAVINVDGERVCWNTRGNKLAIATKRDYNILVFDL